MMVDLPRVAVIMAGGVGERFWPLSRQRFPKQLLPLAGGRSLLEESHDRIAPLVPEGRVHVITTADLAEAVAAHAPFIPRENILTEPMRRNTAACLALASAILEERHGPHVMAVTTADHIIGDVSVFRAVLERALSLAVSHEQLLVFGVRPTRPETGYGYIELGPVVHDHPTLPCHEVRGFREKPDHQTAERYLGAGNFLWNSGMFVWRSDVLHAAFAEHAKPYAWRGWERSALSTLSAAGAQFSPAVARVFEGLPNLSIDYAVMEKASNIWGLPASFDWIDIGGWEALRALLDVDEAGNARQGATVLVDTRDSTLHSTGPLIATCGVENLVVVATPDAVLVCPRDRLEEVKRVVAALKNENQESHL
ncbi:mannose-1-phosphate guanylyltransferase [Candidatus Sumerlaeota bacterium]|nr:mannose-1-phosphate guanylyltransferase [Candidatus Sumerlaeota bacterium]